jgi:hypothetical protein
MEIGRDGYAELGLKEVGEWTKAWRDGESVIALSKVGAAFVAHSGRCTDPTVFVRLILRLVREAKKMGATELVFGEKVDNWGTIQMFLDHGFKIESVQLRGSI